MSIAETHVFVSEIRSRHSDTRPERASGYRVDPSYFETLPKTGE